MGYLGENVHIPAARSDGLARLFVWALWWLLFLAALAFVSRYGSRIPFADEWFDLVPAMTGGHPITTGWLWGQGLGTEHRLAVLKLVYLATFRLAGRDLRGGLFLTVLALGALSLAMIRVARITRGRTCWTDAVFPLALLHWGHAANLLWCFQLFFVISLLLAAAVLLCAVRERELTAPRSVLAGAALLLLPLCGGSGLIHAPFIALWFLYAAAVQWWIFPDEASPINPCIQVAFALMALLLSGLYFYGYVPPPQPRAEFRDGFLASAQFLSTSFGPGGKSILGIPLWPALALLSVALLIASSGLLAAVWLYRPQERIRAAGMISFAVSFLVMAAAVGLQRPGFGPEAGLTPRYVTPASLMVCWAYYVWSVFCPATFGHCARWLLFGLLALLLPWNTLDGMRFCQDFSFVRHVEHDIERGDPLPLVVQQHDVMVCGHAGVFEYGLRMLRATGVQPFHSLQDGPAIGSKITLPVPPIVFDHEHWLTATDVIVRECPADGKTESTSWKTEVMTSEGSIPRVVLIFSKPRFVCGVQIRWSSGNRAAMDAAHVHWKSSASEASRGDAGVYFPLGTEAIPEVLHTIWVYDVLEEFCLIPGNLPCDVRIGEITLLLPAAGDEPG